MSLIIQRVLWELHIWESRHLLRAHGQLSISTKNSLSLKCVRVPWSAWLVVTNLLISDPPDGIRWDRMHTANGPTTHAALRHATTWWSNLTVLLENAFYSIERLKSITNPFVPSAWHMHNLITNPFKSLAVKRCILFRLCNTVSPWNPR